MNVRIKFLGAAGTVTGSRYILEIDNYKLLIDCGLFQGPSDLRRKNWEEFPVDPKTINAIILTHAHIDHTGYLPRLVNQGFEGPIYATEATVDLLDIMLKDAAKLQEEEAEWAFKKGYTKHSKPLPLFTMKDAESALSLLKPRSYQKRFHLNDFIIAEYFDAGHILGSAILQLTLKGDQQEKIITFSGDLGRYEQPLHYPPQPIAFTDILLMESTYGDRENDPLEIEENLTAIINETIENGCVLIPAFAVGRTQTVIYYLHKLMNEKKIPEIPIYIDSPMAINTTALYKRHFKYHKLRKDELEASIFDFPQIHYYRIQEESISLNEINNKAIIISASGMATGGRILHHLYHRLPREHDTLLFVGYQGKGSRGRELLHKPEIVNIFGIEVAIKCRIEQINGLSAHADKSELMKWAGNFKTSPKRTFIIHGEEEPAAALGKSLKEDLGWDNIFIPQFMESFELFDSI